MFDKVSDPARNVPASEKNHGRFGGAFPDATSTRCRSAVHVLGQDNPSSRRRFVFLIAAFSVL